MQVLRVDPDDRFSCIGRLRSVFAIRGPSGGWFVGQGEADVDVGQPRRLVIADYENDTREVQAPSGSGGSGPLNRGARWTECDVEWCGWVARRSDPTPVEAVLLVGQWSPKVDVVSDLVPARVFEHFEQERKVLSWLEASGWQGEDAAGVIEVVDVADNLEQQLGQGDVAVTASLSRLSEASAPLGVPVVVPHDVVGHGNDARRPGGMRGARDGRRVRLAGRQDESPAEAASGKPRVDRVRVVGEGRNSRGDRDVTCSEGTARPARLIEPPSAALPRAGSTQGQHQGHLVWEFDPRCRTWHSRSRGSVHGHVGLPNVLQVDTQERHRGRELSEKRPELAVADDRRPDLLCDGGGRSGEAPHNAAEDVASDLAVAQLPQGHHLDGVRHHDGAADVPGVGKGVYCCELLEAFQGY